MPTSRRSFFSSAAGIAAFAGAASAADGPASAGAIRLGVASYSFREFQRNLCIRDTKKLGVTLINVKDFHLPMDLTPDEMAKARQDFAKAGLTLEGGGTIYFLKNDDADIRPKFEYAKAAGFPLIVAGPTHETLPALEKYVKEYNIKIAVHNHGPEDKHFPTPDSVLQVVKNMDPRMGLCIDVGHTVRTGTDPVEAIRAAGPRLLSMHIKDLAELSAKESQVPVGDGKMPIPAIFTELRRIHYPGGVMLEYEIDADNPLPGMQKSFAYMRGVLAGQASQHS